ncbi:MAG: 2-oxoglutarate and iron-dependent oxygenase domain-containing protein [Pseudomonadota bacterium]
MSEMKDVMAEFDRKPGVPLCGPPLLDVRGLFDADRGVQKRVANEIGQAARDIGFFRITGHGIDGELISRTYEAAQRFFALPEELKRKYYIGLSSNHRGYVPFTEKGDYSDEKSRNYEAFDLALDLPETDPDFLAGNRLLGPNVWPELDGFQEAVAEYYEQISSLGLRVCAALELYLDLPPGKITGHMTKPISQLRLMHYVRQSDNVDSRSVNMGAHTDYECLTLLHTSNPGLQVMDSMGKWIDVPVDPGTFVVNIGDMLEAWTNGHLRSTPHRVLNLSAERYSLPYFVAANFDTVISPFPEVLRPGEEPRYKPFRAGAHLERMLIRDFPYLAQKDPSGAALSEPVHNPFEDRLNRGAS